jgi:uncharacterized protein YjbI with pentapeptide repeats
MRERRYAIRTLRKLQKRWQEKEGQELRSEILTTLRENSPLPHSRLANFTGAPDYPPGLDLRFINLRGQNLDGADLSRARLQGANLGRASLKGAKLVDATLQGAHLRKTDLTGADLRGVNLRDAIMEDTKLDSADLTGAVISDSTVLAGTTQLPPNVIVRGAKPDWAPVLHHFQHAGERR